MGLPCIFLLERDFEPMKTIQKQLERYQDNPIHQREKEARGGVNPTFKLQVKDRKLEVFIGSGWTQDRINKLLIFDGRKNWIKYELAYDLTWEEFCSALETDPETDPNWIVSDTGKGNIPFDWYKPHQPYI